MNASDASVALASFETKWIDASPELALGLRFVAPALRDACSAFQCVLHELEYAAFGIADPQPAALKLQWWAEEFALAAQGQARHPLTRTLSAETGGREIPAQTWYAAVAGAFAQRDAQPAADAQSLLAGYQALYTPLAQIQAQLFAGLDAGALARAHALACAVRETLALGEVLGSGRLPVPLDVLARHRLARGELSQSSPAQQAALRAWLAQLRQLGNGLHAARIGPLAAARWRADEWRLGKAWRAADPLATLHAAMARLPLRAAWAAWRARTDHRNEA